MQSNTKSHLALRALIEGAIMIALAWALDALVPPFYRFPAGGSVDLAMIISQSGKLTEFLIFPFSRKFRSSFTAITAQFSSDSSVDAPR